MDGAGGFNNNFSLILMLIVTIVLISVNTLEIINLKNLWQRSMTADNLQFFEKCMKHPFILKAFFVFYSLCSTFSIFTLTFALLLNANIFIRKFSKSFINFNYYVFGPGMTIPGILAFCNFDKFVYTCELRQSINLVFNISNAFSIILCFIIGLVIWISKGLYDTFVLYSNSMTRHPDGNSLLKNAFWWSVMKIGISNHRNNNIDQEALVNNSNNASLIIINENYVNLENERDIRIDYDNNLEIESRINPNINEDLENNLNTLNSNYLNHKHQNEEVSLINKDLIIEQNLQFLNNLKYTNANSTNENKKNKLLEEEMINDNVIINHPNSFINNFDHNDTQINNINNSNILDNTFNIDEINESDERKNKI